MKTTTNCTQESAPFIINTLVYDEDTDTPERLDICSDGTLVVTHDGLVEVKRFKTVRAVYEYIIETRSAR
jgi:hypothetical protein